MRIILCLAAGLGAAAIATAAAAKPGASGTHGGGPRPGWSGGGGDHAGGGLYFRHAPSGIKGYGGQGRRHGRFGRNRYNPYGGFGIAGPVGAVDPWGNGYFNGGGGEVRMSGGRPHYDYDRSYPYEWSSAGGGRQDWEEEGEEMRATERPARCTFENSVRVCRGW
jgi:hypothetical protein